MSEVTLTINDRQVKGKKGDTVLEICQANGIDVPTLCRLDGLSNVGACRICLVEMERERRLLPACAYPARDGLVVKTNTERLAKYRRLMVELIFAERNHFCAVCVSNGHCELQALAQSLGMDHVRFPYRNPQLELDASHSRFAIDHNRCILCTRCVRVCGEIEGARTQGTSGRGITSLIIADLAQPWGEAATCTSCGKCVQVCPTGALFEKGRAAAEMVKSPDFITSLLEQRGSSEARTGVEQP